MEVITLPSRKNSFIEEELKMDEEDLQQLLWRLKDPKKGVQVKDRKKTLKTYKKCFTGKDLTEWLLSAGVAVARPEAVKIASELYSKKHFTSVQDKMSHFFRDENSAFYRWAEKEESTSAVVSPTQEVYKEKPINMYKICVLGAERSGKTAFCTRWSSGSFSEDSKSAGANSLKEEPYKKEKVFLNMTNETANVELLDTGSILTEDFESKLNSWSEWASGFMLVYSICSRASFENIPKLFNLLIKTRQFRMTPILVVATKGDLEEERKVSKEDGNALAARYRCKFIEISSKNGQGINDAMELMANTVRHVQYVAGPVQHKTGWAKMRTGANRTYKKRFLVMTHSGLRYYDKEPASHNDTSCMKGIIPMQHCQIETFNFLNQEFTRRHSDPNIHPVNGGVNRTTRSSQSSPSDRKMSDASDNSGENLNLSAPATSSPMSKRLDRNSSMTNINMHKEKLRIYIIDRTDCEYELLMSSMEERDQWFEALSQCIEKASQLIDRSRSASIDSSIPPIIEEKPTNGQPQEKLSEEEIFLQTSQRFNKSPKKGISFLLGTGAIEDSPAAVAKFLYTQSKILKKTAIGEFLGEGDAFNLEVLQEYLLLIEFSNLEFDEALRLFLSYFTIPGEAQKIDRIMERFAGRYCKCNPTAFQNPDVGYILAFSLIMLNTDAHNQNIKPENKMTKEQFVTNNRGIDNGKDLPREVLEGLYTRIVQREIQMEHERDDFSQWDKQGFVYVKESKTRGNSTVTKKHSGKKLFIILSACCLYIFESPTDKKPLHIIPLGNLQIDSLFDDRDEKDGGSGFVLYHPDPKDSIKSAVDGKEVHLKELVFVFDSRKTKMEWMLTFKLNLVSAPNYK